MTSPVRAALLLLIAGASCAKADGGFDGGPTRSDGALLPDAGGGEVRADAATDAEPHGDATPVINEFVANHGGDDDCEYVEIAGAPGTDYSRYTVITVEGDAGNGPGEVQAVLPVGTTGDGGFWVSGFLADQLQNGSSTLLLVADFAAGTPDIDTDDDGTIDAEPWSELADAVAIADGDASDIAYAAALLTRTFDGESSVVGGASRIPDGTDTDQPADWVRNLDNAAGLPCATASTPIGAAANTPGAPNESR